MKVVINRCFGGFGVSEAVYKELGLVWDGYGYPCNDTFGIISNEYNAYRAHPPLIAAIEKVGLSKASGSFAYLHIKEIPDGADWEIEEYDGRESLRQPTKYF